jgi:hypothetical protein
MSTRNEAAARALHASAPTTSSDYRAHRWEPRARAALAAADAHDAEHGIRRIRISRITTADELLALPEGSVVIDREGDVSQKRDSLWCGYEMAPISSQKLTKIAGPFTILHEGSEATR